MAPAGFNTTELDYVDDDIRDVATPALLKDMAAGRLVFVTVEDYCRHMVRCSETDPEEVASVLGIPPAEQFVASPS